MAKGLSGLGFTEEQLAANRALVAENVANKVKLAQVKNPASSATASTNLNLGDSINTAKDLAQFNLDKWKEQAGTQLGLDKDFGTFANEMRMKEAGQQGDISSRLQSEAAGQKQSQTSLEGGISSKLQSEAASQKQAQTGLEGDISSRLQSEKYKGESGLIQEQGKQSLALEGLTQGAISERLVKELANREKMQKSEQDFTINKQQSERAAAIAGFKL